MPKRKTDPWQSAIDKALKICDEMMKAEDYRTAAIVAKLRERLLKLRSEPKRTKP